LKNNSQGLLIAYTKNSLITGNNIKNNGYGVRLDESSNNTITGNNITHNGYGFWLSESTNNIMSVNNVTKNGDGIWFSDSSNNNWVSGNNITDNSIGIKFYASSNNTLRNNHMSGKQSNFDFWGYLPSHYFHDIDSSNTVDGKPVYYLVNKKDLRVPVDAGYVALVNSTNITVKNLNLKNNSQGLLIAYTKNSLIADNTITNSYHGIRLEHSFDNIISGNNVTKNGDGILLSYSSDNNSILGNNVTDNSNGIRLVGGTVMGYPTNNAIRGNNVTDNCDGIVLDFSSNNIVSGNGVTKNSGAGIYIFSSDYNSISGNNIIGNSEGIKVWRSSDNTIYHNNVINNTNQVFSWRSANIWDDGYPSGGNYWSDYTGVDLYNGPNQDGPGSDGIGDTAYIIDADNRDRIPLMKPWTSPEHELVVCITAPTFLRPGSLLLINATVRSEGLNDEADVELMLFINNTIVESTTIPLLKAGHSHTLSYLWSPVVEGTCNITAFAHPVLGEASMENNQKTILVTVAEVNVGVKAGDWIECDYAITGWPPETPYPLTIEIKFLSVQATIATIQATMHMSDGTEESDTLSVDIAGEGETFQGLSGFIIPSNRTTGDSIYMTGYGTVTIAGETTRTYAGASRTVVYTSFSQYGVGLTYYWDKQTGVMVEAATTSGNIIATAKATATNMWQTQPLLIGDLDNDGKIDIQDLYEAALAFGSYPGHSRWNSNADLNNDNGVGIMDIALIAKNFGA